MSNHRTNSRSLSLTGASRWSVVLRIFMLLAAWQGPLPWCHCHGTLISSDIGSAPRWLAEHLQTHHAAVSAFSSVCFGWHVHAVIPGSSNDDPAQPKKAEQYRLPNSDTTDCLAGHSSRAADGLSVSLAQQIALPQNGLAGRGESDSRCVAHFFDRFAPSLPLPLRFCVARC